MSEHAMACWWGCSVGLISIPSLIVLLFNVHDLFRKLQEGKL